MKRIALLTSGGDAPGMNAAIRAVTRRALHHGAEVLGVRRGYAGLIAGDFVTLGPRDVGRILHLSGTMLGSARCADFRTDEGVAQAVKSLGKRGIEGLVVIGGNGSQAGGHAIMQLGFPVVGVPSTIDNDLCGTDVTVGVDTALNIALEGNRSFESDRLISSARFFGGNDGTQLWLSRFDGGTRRRRGRDRYSGSAE